MRISVDDAACAGHGACTTACPEVFVITDDGYAEAITTEIPTNLEAAVADAAASCPEHAIHVIEENHVL
jgi:ferredoxin